MQVNVTARHTKLTPALKEYAEKKLLQVKKYVEKITTAHIILNVEKDRHIAEVVLDISKHKIAAKAVAGDMYGAIDLVMDKASKQVKKHMDKVKEHRELPYSVVADVVFDGKGVARSKTPPKIKDVEEYRIKEQSILEAVETMEKRNHNFCVFKNVDGGRTNIVYKREDGSRGLLILK